MSSRHTAAASPPPPPSEEEGGRGPSRRRGKKKGANVQMARTTFRLTSPYGPSSDTILYRIEINHPCHPEQQEGHAALVRMAQYCRIHQAVPYLRPRESFPRVSEEQVLYVRIMDERQAWGRLRHQAQRLGLTPRLVRDTNEIPDEVIGVDPTTVLLLSTEASTASGGKATSIASFLLARFTRQEHDGCLGGEEEEEGSTREEEEEGTSV